MDDMSGTLDIFKALSDDVRLRIVRAVLTAELSVAELVEVLGLPQSTVSRHLKPLRDGRLVETRREGTSIYYRKGAQLADTDLAHVLDSRLKELPTAVADTAAVRRVIDHRRQRSKDFFEKVAGKYSSLTQPGGGWEALAAALAVGFAGKDVADLGSGEGALTLLLARFAKSVTAVDLSPAMLRQVKQRAKKAGVAGRVKTAEGDLESLPLKGGTLDAAFLSQALHHAARPEAAVIEAARVLRQGGHLVVLDLVRHDREWVREQWADQWLGFDSKEIEGWMREGGLRVVVVERIVGATPELAVLLVVGIKI
ncbi:MAG: metalloregulator ArsR/SmtB family transcription factor [bacterium]